MQTSKQNSEAWQRSAHWRSKCAQHLSTNVAGHGPAFRRETTSPVLPPFFLIFCQTVYKTNPHSTLARRGSRLRVEWMPLLWRKRKYSEIRRAHHWATALPAKRILRVDGKEPYCQVMPQRTNGEYIHAKFVPSNGASTGTVITGIVNIGVAI